MSGGFISPVALVSASTDELNYSNGVMPVSIQNINLSANQILYTVDGATISGLNPSSGLSVVSTDLKTVGNPAIQLVSNSLFANDNTVSIQSQIDIISQADVLYISSGSYTENLTITNKINCGLVAPLVGNSITEIVGNLTLSGTSEQVRFSNLQFDGALSTIGGVGRHFFERDTFQGSAMVPHVINIGSGMSQFITFENCEFDQYCTVNISATFANVCYFINCNFDGATINLLQASPLQVVFNNCAGFVTFPLTTKCTLVGLNVLTTGVCAVSTNLGSVECETMTKLKYLTVSGGDDGGTGKSLTSDATGLKWVTPHTNVVKFLKHDHGALTAQSALTVDVVPVFTRVTTANDCLFQFYAELYCTISGYQTYALLVDGISVETFQAGMTLPNILTNITYTFKSTLTAGSHTFKVTATATSGTLETNANSCYQYTLSQIV